MKLHSVFIFALVFFVVGCTPCKKGHNETYRVAGYMQQDQPTIIQTGKHSSITIPHSHYVPAHDESRWVCDEYETSK